MSRIRAQRDASPRYSDRCDDRPGHVFRNHDLCFLDCIPLHAARIPSWVVGTYGYFTALGTGSAGLGAAVIHSLVRRDPAPDYVRLIGVCLIAIFLMIVAIILIDRYLVVKSSNDVAAASQADCKKLLTSQCHPERDDDGDRRDSYRQWQRQGRLQYKFQVDRIGRNSAPEPECNCDVQGDRQCVAPIGRHSDKPRSLLLRWRQSSVAKWRLCSRSGFGNWDRGGSFRGQWPNGRVLSHEAA